jgi:ribosomal protein S18 acetylase RimI-like enzyme
MARIDVRDMAGTDRAAWDRMWSGYCAHYGVSLAAADNDALWRRLTDADSAMAALIGVDAEAGRPIGFAHYVLHPHTFSARMVCYLEDLWVDPAARGGGGGRNLIDALIARGRERGWRRLYWHTEADNTAARALYDRIVPVTDYVRYDVALQ